ncbi:MAG TPA: TIGR00268 family protein [Desulfobulbaceae bacterium]|nr:TIGR00268 family protein [Desulfobulbaceae bacterium]
MSLEKKTLILHAILQKYERVAVAFSGGVDSSFLLKSALSVLGAGNVLVLYGRSCLISHQEQQLAENWPVRHGFGGVEFQVVELQPLFWKEFVSNTTRRCYYCKLRMYKEFFEEMRGRELQILLDGTNTDDLKDGRPGLQAIHELGVKTPLVQAGFDKKDVRACSRDLTLDTWDIPSSSCLATRIPSGLEITEDRLRTAESYEEGMKDLGFIGCRVHLHPVQEETVFLQLQHADFNIFFKQGLRLAVVRFFQKSGVRNIFLDLVGR